MNSSHPVRMVSWRALWRLGSGSQRPAGVRAVLAAEERGNGSWAARGPRCCARHWCCFEISAVDRVSALRPQPGMSVGTQSFSAGLAVRSWWHGISRKLPCLPGDCAWLRGVCWEAKSHVQLKAPLSSHQGQTSHRVPCSTCCSDIQGQPGSFH